MDRFNMFIELHQLQ
jgi:hypothetical protein